ncbi:MAG: monovalent cation/H+ antiporter subunit D family protein [Desulfobacterales bacterium]|nr:monovalent cation/H+ antiporter subunit D family protein [Desulfobacterales bacterium]
MSAHLPVLIVVVPLLSAFVIALAGWINAKYCLPAAIVGLGVSLYASARLLMRVIASGPMDYFLGGWAPPVGIAYRVDHLNGLILVVVAAVALINLIGTHKSVTTEYADRIGPFYTLYVLFVTGLFGIVVTGDAFNLFVLLEITSLTGYAMIGIGRKHAPLASLNYIFMGTIGASFYLLGIGYLYLVTGTLNMADLAAILPHLYDSKVVMAAFIICMTGLFMKMALFPLHAWLPNAYTFAPGPVSSLIAPLTTKVMIYVMVRIVLTVFTPDFAFDHLHLSHAVVWIAVIAIVMGSVMALGQTSLKRMLSYIVIAEVGYMVGGFWLGNRMAMTGAILHIVNDAAMTLCVFMAAASIRFRLKSDSFESLRGAFGKMPFTMGALVVGGISIIGVPPTCGFFSKWYLISGGIAAGHWAFVSALIFSSLVNAVLFFRIFEISYFEPFTDHHAAHVHGGHVAVMREAPASMVAMLILTAAGLVVLGIYSGDIVTKVIEFAIPAQIV